MLTKLRFHGLDGLRGICALSVVLLHSELLFNAGAIFCHGYLAVDMFFILSGFVICAGYDARLANDLTPFQFFKLRLRRLAPVYWAGLVLCVAAGLVRALYDPAIVPARILMLGGMAAVLAPILGARIFAYPANPVAWSLAWEILVNVAYASGLRRLATRHMLILIGLLLAAATAQSFVNPRGWSFGMTGSDLALGGLRAVPEFLMGVVLYRAYGRGAFNFLPRVSPLLPLAAWAVLAVLPQGLSPLVDLAIVILACPLLIAALVRGEAQAPGWFSTLGALSYPLYASHLALIELAQHTPLFGLNRGARPVLATLVVVLAVGVAWIIHRTFDPAAKKRETGFGAAHRFGFHRRLKSACARPGDTV